MNLVALQRGSLKFRGDVRQSDLRSAIFSRATEITVHYDISYKSSEAIFGFLSLTHTH